MEHEIKIITNNRPRPVLYWWELTKKEQKEFDYLDTELKQIDASFVRYKGNVYDLGDTEYINPKMNASDPPFAGWHSRVSDSFFSGILFKLVNEDFSEVICGRYYS